MFSRTSTASAGSSWVRTDPDDGSASLIRFLRPLVPLLVATLLLAACDQPDEASEQLIIENPRPAAPARTVGFDTENFRVGVLVDLTGPGAEEGASLLAGAEAYWSTVNAVGGIDSRFPVELVVRDTGGSAAQAVAAFREIESDVAMFSLVGETEPVDAIRMAAGLDDLLLVPATRQSTWLVVENLLPMGASYAVEAFAAVTWMSRADTSPAVLCTVNDSTPVGDDLLVGALLAVGAHDNLADPIALDISEGSSPEATAAAVASAGCERLLVATDGAVSAPIIEALAAASVDVEVAVGSEIALPLSDDAEIWAQGRMVVATDAPGWGDDQPGPSALRSALDLYLPDAWPDPWIRMGFATQYVTDALLTESVRRGSVARADLLELASNLTRIDTDGLVGSPDFSDRPLGYVESVTIHEVVPVGGDPLGLQAIGDFVPPSVEAIEVLFG